MFDSDEPAPGSRLFTQQEVTAGLASAELIPLLVAVAAIRQDASMLEARFRPALLTPAVGVLAQGGLSDESVTTLRERLTKELSVLTTADLDLQPLSDDFLLECLEFLTGQRDEGYLPILRRELNWGADVARPPTDLGVRAAGRRVAIVGGGMSGIAMATRLVQAGVDFVLFEKNHDVGGTWFENRYPGCRLDTSNFGYSYSFAQTNWRHHFSLRADVGAYLRGIAESEGVLPFVRFGAEVRSMEWEGECWRLDIDGDTERFDFVVSAVGQLNRPKFPTIPGIDTFAGDSWHSATWPDSAEIVGKRVALVGTGASGYQIGPAIADEVDSLTIFQRTPPWILPTPGYSSEIPAAYSLLLDRLPAYRRWLRFQQFWVAMDGRMRFTRVDPDWQQEGSVSAVNAEFRTVLEQALEEMFEERTDLLESAVPNYPPGSKRILRDDGAWARTLRRDDVDVVTEGIERIEPHGIVTTSGRLVDIDVIVFATGFEADRFLSPMKIVGEDGRILSEQWGDRAESYMGMSVHGFPNFAMLYGPNQNLVINGSLVFLIECAVDRIIRMIEYVSDQDAVSIDVPQTIVDEFVQDIDRENETMAWGDPRVSNWYKGASGRVVSVWPYSMRRFWDQTHRDDFASWTLVRQMESAR